MKIRIAIVSLLACLVVALPTLAQVSSNYDLSWHVIAGGGGQMESTGGHALPGTAGQVPVGKMMTGGGHSLCGGFWCSAVERYRIYLPLVVRNSSSTSGLIFSDNFSDGTLNGWTSNQGTWTLLCLTSCCRVFKVSMLPGS